MKIRKGEKMRLNVKKYELLLAQKCLTVNELSDHCGISPITLSKLKNKHEARPQTIGKIAKALNVLVEEIVQD